ncbi:cyclin-dependent kinase inhibitor 1C-like [Salvia splendens]|uniref:cyclin-dependent kinase inhibitor 1C-like n=1 Tax=Salvia splendens TaxID=180675 RepID=UPI001C26D3BF|nr:cyclin-dependent kinase inhibitor 1C-like [Salvia splendens]
MDNTTNTGSTSRSGDSNAAPFMADLLQKLGGPKEAMKAFAMFAATMGKTTPAVSTSAAPPPPKISEASPPQPEAVHAVAEPATAVAETTTAEIRVEEADLAAGLELLAGSDPRLDSFVERETPVTEKFGEGEIPGVCESVSEERTLEQTEGDEALISEKAVEGETLEVFGGSEAHVSENVSEGKTPERAVGTETHDEEGSVGVETPIYITGPTPLLTEEGEALDSENVQDPVGERVKLIMDVPKGTISSANARDARRRARRSLLDEVDDTGKEALG